MKQELLRVENLSKVFPLNGNRRLFQPRQFLKAVDDVSFQVYEGETLGVVGESGCGKSTLGRMILRLLPPTSGKIYYDGQDLLAMPKKELREKRQEMQIVFQDPYASLDPRMKIGDILAEPLLCHCHDLSLAERSERVAGLMEQVGLSPDYVSRFPHEFSGGQRQRIGIARAIALNPRLIVCDEAVSALDVSVQAQILNLLVNLQEKYGLTYFFISHGLNVIRHISKQICVMYLGKIMEIGDADMLFRQRLHPYTKALFSAVPTIERIGDRSRIILQGDLPSPVSPPKGCRFHTRCPYKMQICTEVEPLPQQVDEGYFVACHLYGEKAAQAGDSALYDAKVSGGLA